MPLFKNLHVSICNKCKEHRKQVYSTACTRRLVWHDEENVRLKLNVPTTQHQYGSLAPYSTSSNSFWTEHIYMDKLNREVLQYKMGKGNCKATAVFGVDDSKV
jgi:hypothetical protein